jgi:hypothetical protein
MTFDITAKHPAYNAFSDSWELMRDAIDGEDSVKQKGEKYLPMKSGIVAMKDMAKQSAAYNAYKNRAEFPELVAPTVRGTIGVMLDRPAAIELPPELETLKERSTRNGMPLDVLHRLIAAEVMSTGRFGLLPGIDDAGLPYIGGYSAESIINWDVANDIPNYVVLDETGELRDPETNAWKKEESYLECKIEDGKYVARTWKKAAGAGTFSPDAAVDAKKPPKNGRADPLTELPFVFINTSHLEANPDDVPLYGLAKLAVRIYRLDADYTFAMHMTSEPTPWVSGFDNPKKAAEDGSAPKTIGSSVLWVLPKEAQAGFLEFTGAGIAAQEKAIAAALDRAVAMGAQILTDKSRSAESGEARKLRLGNQSSVLKIVSQTTAAGLERALKNIAVWMNADPAKVKVTPNVDFFDHTLDAQGISAVVKGWLDGAYSYPTAFLRLQKGGVIHPEKTIEDELKEMDEDDVRRGTLEDRVAAMTPPLKKPGTTEPAKPLLEQPEA